MSDYTLDTGAAKQADNFFSKIDTKGKYMGAFTRAEQVTSTKGTKGVDLSFKSNEGATADYLTLWTHNKDGKQLQGFNVLMAIMTCLRVKELKAEDGETEKWDSTVQQRAKVSAKLFKELMNKQIGLLMHMEEYEKTKGGTAWKPMISAPFDKDGFTASEILSRAIKPELLDRMEGSLRDRPLRASPAQAPANTSAYDGSGSFNDFDDDCPF